VENAEAIFSQFTPMASLSYSLPGDWLDNTAVNSAMVYATWSNGFKSGFQEPKGSDDLVVVEPERLGNREIGKSGNREIGFKIDAFQRSLRLNVAIYSMIFEDMQLITAGLDSTGTLVVTSDNAGKSMIEGAEMELSWLPSRDWLITLSYSNNNYKFLDFDDVDLLTLGLAGENKIVDRTDEQFPVSPEETAALGIQ
jgi:iron complex outermembrane receptor protein